MSTKEIADYYSSRSATYDLSEYHQRLSKLLVDCAKIERGNRILDVATGTGLLAIYASRLTGDDGCVIGIDISDGMLDQARHKLSAARIKNVTLMQSDAETADFGECSFDRIICSSAITFMRDVPGLLRRWHRMLKPQGIVAFDSPSKSAFVTGVIVKELAASEGINLPYGNECSSPERCRELMMDAGFATVEVLTEQFGSFINLPDAEATWVTTLRHPLSKELLALPPQTLDRMRIEFVARLRALTTPDGIWNDGTMLLVIGRK